MQFFPFLSLLLAAHLTTSEEVFANNLLSSEPPHPAQQTSSLRWGAQCTDKCASEVHIICRNSTCVCDATYPVYLKQTNICSRAISLGGDCQFDEECVFSDKNAHCRVYSELYKECDCKEDFEIKEIIGLKPPRLCYPAISDKDVPTFLGFGLGLSLMSAMICLALRIFARARFARPRRYANANIAPPLTVSETYAAFALARDENGHLTPVEYRPIGVRSASSSRRPSYTSMQQYRPGAGNIYRLGSSPSIAGNRAAGRRPSAASVKSFRSQSGLLLSDLRPEPDHYIVYMIRGPSRSMGSDSTTMTTCDSASPRSSDQQNSPVDRGTVGKSHTTASFRTISSEDVFEEEDEDLEEEEEQASSNNRV